MQRRIGGSFLSHDNSKEKAQLHRNWWDEEREAERRGWLRGRSEREWLTDRWVVTIVECVDCGVEEKKEELNEGQGHLPENSLRNSQCPRCQENWEAGQWEVSRGRATRIQCVECRKVDAVLGRLGIEEIRSMKCPQCMKRKESREAAQPGKVKAQQAEKEGERVLRCTVQPLNEVWLKIGIEKVNTHEGVTVKALLDSGATGMFADKKFIKRNGFKLERLDRPVRIKNIDEMGNSGGLVTHEIEVNVYYQEHVERMKLDICDLERTEVILGML